MTIRQRILKLIYPLQTFFGRLAGIQNRSFSSPQKPLKSFYQLSAELNNGKILSFETFRNKNVLLVNTASDCGYTNQYDGLEKLFKSTNDLEILAFPSNDFKNQEMLNDEEIAAFCKVNYGVTFPLVKKSFVRRSHEQHEVFQWLSDPEKNGWNKRTPSWNFCKYLIDKEGNLRYYFEAAVEPGGEAMQKAIRAL